MEEDIKKLEEKINNIKKYNTYRYDWTETDIQTIEHLIKAYKELEKELNSIKEIYYTQKEIEENSIPVSLVEEAIEEYKKKIIEARKEDDDCKEIYYKQEIEIMQKLLEKRK